MKNEMITNKAALEELVKDAGKKIIDAAFGIEEPPKPELTGMAKFLNVGRGVQLVRFAGKDEIKLVGRRVGTNSMPNALFEIMVDKGAKLASVWKDSKILFEIRGVNCNYSRVEKMAVSALHRWFKDQRPSGAKRKRARLAREAVSSGATISVEGMA